jgi:hypothetical protein
MRTSNALVTAATIATVGLLLAGCASLTPTVNTNAATTSTATTKASTTTAAKAAGLGSTINVTDESGDKLAVTLVKVDAKASSTDGFSTPPAGDSYYAVQVQIKDVGTAAWSDSPSNCLTVKDGKGQAFQADLVEGISSGPLMTSSANIAAGDSTLGWVVFDVPSGDKVAEVQFTPLSGMASSTAQWSL